MRFKQAILFALKKIRITAVDYMLVEQIWLGDVAWMKRMAAVMIKLFNPVDSSNLDAIQDKEGLKNYLNTIFIDTITLDYALEILSASDSFYTLGKKLYEKIGVSVQLDLWQKHLESFDDEKLNLVTHIKEFKLDFKDNLDEAYPVLCAVIKKLVIDASGVYLFGALSEELLDFTCPSDLPDKYWKADFVLTMKSVGVLFTAWGAKDDLSGAITSSQSLEELIANLTIIKVDLDDPFVIHSNNSDSLKKSLEMTQQIALIWCVNNVVSPNIWDKSLQELIALFADILESDGYLTRWDENYCYQLTNRLSKDSVHKPFWDLYDSVTSNEALKDLLGISDEDLKAAHNRLEEKREEIRKKNRSQNVCGKDFDNTEENLDNLWALIELQVPDNNLIALSMEKFEEKSKVSKKKPGGDAMVPKNKDKKTTSNRSNKALDKLKGLAGEIHAYRILQKSFPGAITPSCWVSENSLYKYKGNPNASDRKGCDFEFTYKKRKYYIEVKATSGEDNSFELGSTEIDLALQKVGGKKGEFRILRITNAFETHPESQFMPNPFDPRFKGYYEDIENSGMRIKYREK